MIYTFITRLVNFLAYQVGLTNLKTHTFYGVAITNDSVVIDLGANVGQFAEEISEKFHCICYALEPLPNLFSQIKESPLIKKFNYAISDKNASLRLYVSSNREANSIHESIADSYGTEDIKELPGITLETFLKKNNINMVDLLKIDIEGAEELLFRSTSDETLLRIKQITIEFHDFIEGSISTEEVQNIIKRLELLGFYLLPFSYIFLDMATCDFLFINTREYKIGLKHWMEFHLIKLLLQLENMKSSIVRRYK